MTAPVFFTETAEISGLRPGDSFTLGGPEGHHARAVKRLGPGEALDLVDRCGLRVSGEVAALVQDGLQVRILQEPRTDRPSGLVLVQALAKQDRDLQAAEMATELGVDAVVPWQAERSIVRWKPEKARKAAEKWGNTVAAAAKQSRRARVPEVHELATTGLLCQGFGPQDRVLVLHEQAEVPLTQALRELLPTDGGPGSGTRPGRVWMVVGPEGGISDQELEVFRSVGAQPVLLGQHVLRSSTAGAAAIAVIQAAIGAW